MTNGDKIRSMTDEELARYLCDLMGYDLCGCECPLYNFCLLNHALLVGWLEQECTENGQS